MFLKKKKKKSPKNWQKETPSAERTGLPPWVTPHLCPRTSGRCSGARAPPHHRADTAPGGDSRRASFKYGEGPASRTHAAAVSRPTSSSLAPSG